MSTGAMTTGIEATCGDGKVEGVEECDDGNTEENDYCSYCRLPRCGDHIRNSDEEQCDDGNEIDDDDCLTTCRRNMCGDGFSGGWYWEEECDDGNLISGDGCDYNCQLTRCGNHATSAGEECDDGNDREDDGCMNDCTEARCGDGKVIIDDESGRYEVEECDDANSIEGDGCDSTCKKTGCGSGVVTGREECDDGNDDDYDACLTKCKLNVCGDGEVYAGVEECDDGKHKAGDGCSPDCKYEGDCGDADGNGRVTASDAQQVLLYATDLTADCPAAECDVNASGSVDTSDALGTLRFAVGLYSEAVCLRPVRVMLSVLDEVTLGALQFEVRYDDVPGYFVGENDAVECTLLVDGIASFNHFQDLRLLAGGIMSLEGFSAPTDVASCIIERYGPRSSLTLSVQVVDASDPELALVGDIEMVAEER